MRDLSQYDGLRPRIKTGDLVEWASNGLVGRGIMAVTGKEVSHCSIVVRLPYKDNERRYVIEAVRTGVEFRLLSGELQVYDGTAIWYGLRDIYNHLRDGIAEWAFSELASGKKYDFGGVIGNLFGKVSLDSKRYYCSELIDMAYIRAGIIKPAAGVRRPGDFVPLGIFDSQAHLWGEQA